MPARSSSRRMTTGKKPARGAARTSKSKSAVVASKPRRHGPKMAKEPALDRPPRLQRVLANAGFGSRRSCEEFIVEGRVEVDGNVVTELGTRVDIEQQKVRVDGELLKVKRMTYFAVNKPVGVVCTNSDPAGRIRVIDLVPGGEQMFAVGRLDMASTGLILVTNDGELANRLAHPRYEVEKTYKVTVVGHPGPAELNQLRKGIHLAEGTVRVADVRIKSRRKGNTVLQIVLREGRNREIRRMAARIGHKVVQLERISIGPLKLAEMPPGAYRPLTHDEVRSLRHCVSKAPARRRPPGRVRPGATSSGTAKSRKPASRAPLKKKSQPKRATLRQLDQDADVAGHPIPGRNIDRPATTAKATPAKTARVTGSRQTQSRRTPRTKSKR